MADCEQLDFFIRVYRERIARGLHAYYEGMLHTMPVIRKTSLNALYRAIDSPDVMRELGDDPRAKYATLYVSAALEELGDTLSTLEPGERLDPALLDSLIADVRQLSVQTKTGDIARMRQLFRWPAPERNVFK